MKKSLLIMVAAVMVALGANAQLKRSVPATMVNAPSAVNFSVEKAPALNITDMAVAHRSGKQVARRAASDIAGSYILDFWNYDGDFCTSSSFTIEAASGTINAYDPATDEENVDDAADDHDRLNLFPAKLNVYAQTVQRFFGSVGQFWDCQMNRSHRHAVLLVLSLFFDLPLCLDDLPLLELLYFTDR